MNRIKYVIYLLLIPCFSMMAQTSTSEVVKGRVVEQLKDKEKSVLVGANVFWLNSQNGTYTDENGLFSLPVSPATNQLIISYVGYQPDTIQWDGSTALDITLNRNISAVTVEVVKRKRSTEISLFEPLKIERIGEKELQKAACCDLSESFETNPSIDVAFTDAVTGVRQIQLLGLKSPYTQVTREFMPHARGLAAIYGLVYTPGTWVESMQLNKGTGTVINGFESIAGQINIELRKPKDTDKLYFNAYQNQGGRTEVNLNLSHQLNKNWATGLLLHGKNNSSRQDRNDDGFLDMPLSKELIALHRWQYAGDNGIRFQAAVKGTFINNQGGQETFDPEKDQGTTNAWGLGYNVNRVEGWSKLGLIFDDMPWKSIGFQASAVNHIQNGYYGLRDYDAKQRSFYANFIYQSILSNTNHKFKTGASIQYDDYTEFFDGQDFSRREVVPGIYFEYTYNHLEKLGLVLGTRVDHHNVFGTFITPRLHFRYAPVTETVLRASAGRGQKTANIFSENIGLLASNRDIVILGEDNSKPYGLDAEIAWNFGLNFTQQFNFYGREATLSLDFYRTDFENQIVIDLDQNPQQALFYNLNGRSYSNSFQIQLDYELLTRFDVRLAYRWFDVKTTYSGELLETPLVSAHRSFINMAYESLNDWKFDVTLNWQGQKRLPFTGSNPEPFRLPERSPDFLTVNTQLTKAWQNGFEVYIGAENLLDFRQSNPILSSSDPFSPYFDSSLAWGPIFGRNIYIGMRYRI